MPGGFLLRLQARYRLARAVEHLRAHLDPPRGRTGRSRCGRRASGVATGTRAQLQSAARVIRPSATRATLRHGATAADVVLCCRREAVLNEQQSRDNRKLDQSGDVIADLSRGRTSGSSF